MMMKRYFMLSNPNYPIIHPSRLGLIVIGLADVDLQFDPNYDYDLFVVIFNVDKQIQSYQILISWTSAPAGTVLSQRSYREG